MQAGLGESNKGGLAPYLFSSRGQWGREGAVSRKQREELYRQDRNPNLL